MGTDTPTLRPSKPGAWRERNRKTVALPSGDAVTIRRLTGEFILVMQELFEKFLVATERGAKLKLSVQDQRQYIELLVCEAVVEPKVVPRTQAAGEHELHVDDFGLDLDPLIKAIHEFNEEVLVAPFRPPAGEPDAAPGGGGVPDAAEPAPEGAAA